MSSLIITEQGSGSSAKKPPRKSGRKTRACKQDRKRAGAKEAIACASPAEEVGRVRSHWRAGGQSSPKNFAQQRINSPFACPCVSALLVYVLTRRNFAPLVESAKYKILISPGSRRLALHVRLDIIGN